MKKNFSVSSCHQIFYSRFRIVWIQGLVDTTDPIPQTSRDKKKVKIQLLWIWVSKHINLFE